MSVGEKRSRKKFKQTVQSTEIKQEVCHAMRHSRSRSELLRALAVALLLAPMASGVLAERADRDQPMQIESDALRHDSHEQRSTFTGNVVVTKGSILMRGTRLVVTQDDTGKQDANMQGGPKDRAFFRQKRDGVDEFIEARSDTIDYDSKAGTVRFQGHAEMHRLAGATVQDQVMGNVIIYNERTEVYTVDGAPAHSPAGTADGSGRVRAILAPRQGSAAGAAAPDNAEKGSAAVPLRDSQALPKPAKRR